MAEGNRGVILLSNPTVRGACDATQYVYRMAMPFARCLVTTHVGLNR